MSEPRPGLPGRQDRKAQADRQAARHCWGAAISALTLRKELPVGGKFLHRGPPIIWIIASIRDGTD
jgi:hypothetical protein